MTSIGGQILAERAGSPSGLTKFILYHGFLYFCAAAATKTMVSRFEYERDDRAEEVEFSWSKVFTPKYRRILAILLTIELIGITAIAVTNFEPDCDWFRGCD